MREKSTALVVTGMHRSGTSFVASVVGSMGVEVGRELVPADPRNPRGYFEDVEFLELQRRILSECSPVDDGGHADWGWTPGQRLDRASFGRFQEEARRLAESRAARSRYWGWKDPRTSLLLDFWDGILDDARYLLVYRFPWEVADSMQRTREEVFLRHPEWAQPIWCFYNRHLIDFYEKNADRCVLVSANALPGELPRLGRLLRHKLGVEIAAPPAADAYVQGLFSSAGASDPIARLTIAASSESARLLGRLQELADLPAADYPASSPERPLRFVRPPGNAERPAALSVVVPCCNDRDLVLDAIASVERHAPDDCELIVVNDGSTEQRTLEILRALRRVGYNVIDQDNAGLSAARNAGVRASRGRYLLPLDADNRVRAGFLETAIALLDARAELGVVYGDRELFGWQTGRVHVAPFDLETLLRSNYIDACAVVRREVWSDCGGYDTRLRGLEDWDFWINAARHGWRFHRLEQATFDYRVRPGSLVEDCLQPGVLSRLLAHIHRKHREVFRAHLPRPLRWLGQPANHVFWRGSWWFRSRAWRRHRRRLSRPVAAAPGRS